MYINTLLLKAIWKGYDIFGSDEKTKDDIHKIEAGLGDIITLNWVEPTYSEKGYLNGFKISENIKQLFSKDKKPSIFTDIPESEWIEFMKSDSSINRNKINTQAISLTDNPEFDPFEYVTNKNTSSILEKYSHSYMSP